MSAIAFKFLSLSLYLFIMNFPPQLQQNIEKWATIQGVSPEQFIWQAVAEKIDALSLKAAEKHPEKIRN